MLCWWEDGEDFEDLKIGNERKAMNDAQRPMRDWVFRVKVKTNSNETVCVVGNCPELGNWKNSASVQLVKVDDSEEDGEIWSGIFRIPKNINVKFRYYVCVIIDESMDKNHKNEKLIRRWETNPEPRIISKSAEINSTEGFEVETQIFGEYDDTKSIDMGWLTTETLVQLKLSNNPIKFWKNKLEKKPIYVKVTPISLSRYHATPDTMSNDMHLDDSLDTLDNVDPPSSKWPISEISILNQQGREFHPQNQFGHPYNENDFFIFNIWVTSPEHMIPQQTSDQMSYLVDFYVYSSRAVNDQPPHHIGYCYILPSTFQNSEGQITLPITSVKHRPYGQLTVDYLIAKPIHNFECDMSYSSCKSWSGTGLDIGHRGLGDSFKTTDCSDIRENTIASLKEASSHGADLVEFDVQLTKDRIPVLYHDFHVLIAMKRKRELNEHDMLEIALKDLTLKQLKLLKGLTPEGSRVITRALHFCELTGERSIEARWSCMIYHLAEKNSERFKDDDFEEHHPFPTLKDALEILDPKVGFNIEIKWTMKLKDGSFELNHPMELNEYLDIVLKVILENAGTRKIIFSCFHPDICTMLRLKQNRYPVMFLTCGITLKYEPYQDLRTRNIPIAVHHAISSCILGINVHTEDILRDSSQVKYVIDSGLVMFCWGEDNNSSETIKNLKELGLHGIIYDKIDKYITKDTGKDNVFMVDSSKAAQKELIRIAEMVSERGTEIQMPEANQRPFPESPFEPDIDKVLEATAQETASAISIISTRS